MSAASSGSEPLDLDLEDFDMCIMHHAQAKLIDDVAVRKQCGPSAEAPHAQWNKSSKAIDHDGVRHLLVSQYP